MNEPVASAYTPLFNQIHAFTPALSQQSVAAYIPRTVRRVLLWSLLTTHGDDEYECCEFLPTRHVFTLSLPLSTVLNTPRTSNSSTTDYSNFSNNRRDGMKNRDDNRAIGSRDSINFTLSLDEAGTLWGCSDKAAEVRVGRE